MLTLSKRVNLAGGVEYRLNGILVSGSLATPILELLESHEDLERQLKDAERRIDVMDSYICDEDRSRVAQELKEKGNE